MPMSLPVAVLLTAICIVLNLVRARREKKLRKLRAQIREHREWCWNVCSMILREANKHLEAGRNKEAQVGISFVSYPLLEKMASIVVGPYNIDDEHRWCGVSVGVTSVLIEAYPELMPMLKRSPAFFDIFDEDKARSRNAALADDPWSPLGNSRSIIKRQDIL